MYFLFSDPFQFLEVQYYSRHPEEVILLLPADFDAHAIPVAPLPTPIFTSESSCLSRFYPLKFWRTEDLRDHAHEVALIRPAPDTWKPAATDYGSTTDCRSPFR